MLNQSEYNILLKNVLQPPKTYENLMLIENLNGDAISGVLEVQILSHYKTLKVLKIKALMVRFETPLEITIFHPKPFHKKLFPLNATLHIQGVLQKKVTFEMIQPRVVKEYGKILPIFMKGEAKNAQRIAYTQALITREKLSQTPLPNEIIESILNIFYPDFAFFCEFEKRNAFPPKSLDALKFVEVFLYLQKMRAKKRYFPAKLVCAGQYEDFVASLPFALTKGQKNAIAEIAKDLGCKTASKRLIMGDVGCGKTIVILCSVMIAYPYKSLLMAPTTILAQQLYEEAKRFLPKEVRIGFFSSQTSKKQDFKDFDFVIGTQALLHKDGSLEDFALIMSDEQHRFGTMQRHTLEKLATFEGKKPHILQFSATPIPRTMAMLQSDLIHHTFIQDTPFKKEIQTQIIHKQDFPLLVSHIKNEIALCHQVAIVYPLVEESDNFAYASLQEAQGYWMKHFEGVYSTSGGDKNKDAVIAEFRDKGTILLSTTVIEVGISLPRLSTIVIVGAERMGFATLHQLRGRVSRNGLKGYCFLFTYQNQSQRLQEFAKTENGFEIAELDLKYRKSGDLLEGKNQSGDEFVFFDPSCDERILRQVKNLIATNHSG